MMKSVSSGKIFLADQRGLKETEQVKRLSTFNFEKFNSPDKMALGKLYLFNDDMLAGKKKTCFEVDRDSYIIILPITGAINYLDDTENETDVEVEEVVVVYVEQGANITLSNPFDNDMVNYLCIGLTATEPMPNNPQFLNFDLSQTNNLIKINKNFLPFTISIGRFEGRKEAVYQLSEKASFYAFIISGVFEIDGKLVHEKDGLGLWDTDKIEIEALSNNSIVFTLEFAEGGGR